MQETKQLEYKEKYSKEECLKSVSAFSNEEGGSIIFGISDEGKVLGIEDTDFCVYKSKMPFKIPLCQDLIFL
ncbi:AlbA family DNA-binding domain-containing protein [Fusobacterium necrophorum]|uniref:AlbA family DNA-binding domain-containing protein n=1 Tax=Fusobacterium necrophorum TaxID=859 RepID=UPI0021C4A3B9|nr:ATP-binding protein [Fusobacterium necrophorum]